MFIFKKPRTQLYGGTAEADFPPYNSCNRAGSMICFTWRSMMHNNWDDFMHECMQCKKCGLAAGRTNVVIGRGNPKAKLMLIGEGPGEQEDRQGLPFVGRAGQLLDLALQAALFHNDTYYIANIVKCRPPGNRTPTDVEAEVCLPYLRNQTALMNPTIIVCLGAVAMRHIIDKNARITRIRGTWVKRGKFWMMPTFHPAAILRDESKRIPLFQDLVRVREKMIDEGIWKI